MMALNKEHSQMEIPGIDVADIRVRSLMKNYPFPTDRQSAENFMRAKGIVNIRYNEDSDRIRMGLKNTDNQEDPTKFERTSDLPIYDRNAYDTKYVSMAQRVYKLWLELEKDKHDNKSIS